MTYDGPYADRTDASHVLSQLPPLGGPECADSRLIEAVEAWQPRDDQGPCGGLVLLGPTGVGKTTAAVHLVRRCLARYEAATSTMFALAADLADGTDVDIERAKRVRLLVLDDLGREYDPRNRLFRVLDHRCSYRPTVITSGVRPEELDERFGGAMVRRMFDFRGRKVARVSVFQPKLKAMP